MTIIPSICAACVSILPNDDAYGVFSFTLDSLNISLQETQGTATANNGNYTHISSYMYLLTA